MYFEFNRPEFDIPKDGTLIATTMYDRQSKKYKLFAAMIQGRMFTGATDQLEQVLF